MIASLILLGTIVVLGAPSALIFIPWAMITGNATPLYNATQMIVRIGFRLAGIRVETSGLENVPSHTACIFMSNHVSNLDPPALLPRIPGRTSAFESMSRDGWRSASRRFPPACRTRPSPSGAAR